MNNDPQQTDDSAKNVENPTTLSTISEFSRSTGIRIELLRRLINKQTRQMKKDAWEIISPSIRELLGESNSCHPRRIGPAYRRHAELVEMFSDQKVLLDVFNIFSSSEQQAIVADWKKKVVSKPSNYVSLSAAENELMGAFLAMDDEMREAELLDLVKKSTSYIRSQR